MRLIDICRGCVETAIVDLVEAAIFQLL